MDIEEDDSAVNEIRERLTLDCTSARKKEGGGEGEAAVHLLPCEIHHTGQANVRGTFVLLFLSSSVFRLETQSL